MPAGNERQRDNMMTALPPEPPAPHPAAPAVHRAIDAVWRIEQAKLIAGLTRIVRDVGLAEEFAQEALVAALKQWPGEGVPRAAGRLADGDRQAARLRSSAPQQDARAQA